VQRGSVQCMIVLTPLNHDLLTGVTGDAAGRRHRRCYTLSVVGPWAAMAEVIREKRLVTATISQTVPSVDSQSPEQVLLSAGGRTHALQLVRFVSKVLVPIDTTLLQ